MGRDALTEVVSMFDELAQRVGNLLVQLVVAGFAGRHERRRVRDRFRVQRGRAAVLIIHHAHPHPLPELLNS